MVIKLQNIKFNISTIAIYFVSIIFSIIVGAGLYGYGVDYYSGYSHGFEWNKLNATGFDYLGYKIATLIVYQHHIGVYLTSFILSVSSGFLIHECIKLKQNYSLSFFLIVFLIALHTWPIIMSTSNAMRQGLTMSFMFLTILCGFKKNYIYMIVFSSLGIFMHISGPFIILIVIFATILNKLIINFDHIHKTIINFVVGFFLFFSCYFLLFKTGLAGDDNSRIISGDFRWAFLVISLTYLLFSIFFKSILENSFHLAIFYFSFITPAFLLAGLNWQYERFGMMMLIPYILSFGHLFNNRSYKIYLILSFISLLTLTIYTGMYSIGLT